ncbi:hypothetical protein E2C01_076412 [Portunus trituberculatus]|uniref:Uncharacterized protein n=1 Tax=Portunus trituberculatus TaxID=210409 RepID=A0A5B7ILY9_PORTR|nr:hypothetical protein [Portunus trituberculatus]
MPPRLTPVSLTGTPQRRLGSTSRSIVLAQNLPQRSTEERKVSHSASR